MNNKYINDFRNLNINKRGNKISPHKPILLLAVMELVENGDIASPFIPISKELESAFECIWNHYVPEGEGHNCAMQYPFFHMNSEPFWHLEPLPWHVEKINYSLKDLRKNYYGAIIDAELFEAFCDKSRREEFRKLLVDEYLEKKESPIGTFESIDESEGIIAAEPSLIYSSIDGIRVEEYSEKSIAVYGNVKHLSDDFKAIKGRFNPYLNGGAGWIFPKKRKQELIELINRIERKSEDENSEGTSPKKNLMIVSSQEKKIDKLPRRSKIISVRGQDFFISDTRNSSELLERFVIALGVEKVYNLKIEFLGGYLVDTAPNRKHQSLYSYLQLGGRYWLNTQGSVLEKTQLIQDIAQRLGINIEIEIGK